MPDHTSKPRSEPRHRPVRVLERFAHRAGTLHLRRGSRRTRNPQPASCACLLLSHALSAGLRRRAPLLSAVELRAELRRAIRRRGITVVAAETGAAHQTLRAYLAGARVTSATCAKLLNWYTQYAEGEGAASSG